MNEYALRNHQPSWKCIFPRFIYKLNLSSWELAVSFRHAITTWWTEVQYIRGNEYVEHMADQQNICKHVWSMDINSLKPRQNGRYFADDAFKCIFLNENVGISIKFTLKFVSKDPVNNIPTLVQVMAWRRPGDKPLAEPMVVRLLTHICVTRPQRVKYIRYADLIHISPDQSWSCRFYGFI